MTIRLFGQLTDVTGSNCITIDDVANTDELLQKLIAKFPALSNCKYAIAVNKNIIQTKTSLEHDMEVALLPPFSGG